MHASSCPGEEAWANVIWGENMAKAKKKRGNVEEKGRKGIHEGKI
jgi:hypothetical protein